MKSDINSGNISLYQISNTNTHMNTIGFRIEDTMKQCEHMNLFIIPALASFCHFLFPFSLMSQDMFAVAVGNQVETDFSILFPIFFEHQGLLHTSLSSPHSTVGVLWVHQTDTTHLNLCAGVKSCVWKKKCTTTFSTILTTSTETKQTVWYNFRAKHKNNWEWSQEKLIYAFAENGRENCWFGKEKGNASRDDSKERERIFFKQKHCTPILQPSLISAKYFSSSFCTKKKILFIISSSSHHWR